MLQHSFVLDALETTAADTFLHFEILIEEHRRIEQQQQVVFGESTATIVNNTNNTTNTGHHHRTISQFNIQPPLQSRLRQLVPTIGSFHTPLPLREAFEIYNEKHRLVCIMKYIHVLNFRCM